MPRHELAHLNVAAMKQPLASPEMAEFVANLDRIHAVADAADGFVWRLETPEDVAGGCPFEEGTLVNVSVWRDLASLRAFVYRSAHLEIMRRRQDWFGQIAEAYVVLWWVPSGHRPTEREAHEKLKRLRTHGPTPAAFTFAAPFPAPDVMK